MSRPLSAIDLEAAVLGGTILGGGGGGHARDGRKLGAAALDAGTVRLTHPEELDPASLIAVCAGVGAPGAPDQHVTPDDYVAALRQLDDQVARLGLGELAAVTTNENGGMATVNGWLQAARLDLPLLDCPCNGRAHPTAVMGSLGLHRDDGYRAVAGYAGGRGARRLEGVVIGSLAHTAKVVREASILAGGMVAVARNPVTGGYLSTHGAPGGISHAITVGEVFQREGLSGVASLLAGEVVARGPVADFQIAQLGGYDVGRLEVDGVSLTFANEYMTAERPGATLGAFPDLIMTFREEDSPVVSADLTSGTVVSVLVAPHAALRLSSTMFMPELMEPVRALLRGEPPSAG